MKILTLRFKNINALRGEWFIDFRTGLFAITGATGAGKTTLLDAICIALYRQAPRVELARCADDTIVADKVGDKLKLIETLSGLDFERFTRSMMLSQGQFAAFLNVKASERAKLLEELTGTEIYGQISAAIFERHKQAKTTLYLLRCRAGGMVLLDDETRIALELQIARLNEAEQALSATMSMLNSSNRSPHSKRNENGRHSRRYPGSRLSRPPLRRCGNKRSKY